MAEIVLKLPKSAMLLKECLGNLLSFSYQIILSLISRRALTNQFFSHIILPKWEYVFILMWILWN